MLIGVQAQVQLQLQHHQCTTRVFAQGYAQTNGEDYDDKFAPALTEKMLTVWTVLAHG